MRDDKRPELTPDSYPTRASLFGHLRETDGKARDVAWAEFRRRYEPIIVAFARRCGAASHDVDDVVQEVMTAFLAAENFAYDPTRGRFRGWLMTCTVRAAKRGRRNNFKLGGVPIQDVPDAELAIEPVWNDVWEQQLVSEGLVQLRKIYGGSTSFLAFEEYGLKERDAAVVAAELAITVGAIHQAKARMIKHLRTLVQQIRDADD